MIKTLEISNFKSIKHLKLDCKRINIFIGEPNAGKSNILEALGIFSFAAYPSAGFKSFVRYERMRNLFYDEGLDEPIQISLDDVTFTFRFEGGGFYGEVAGSSGSFPVFFGTHGGLNSISLANYDVPPSLLEVLRSIKLYRFSVQDSFPRLETGFLLPPSGPNLMSLLLSHRELRTVANDIFSRFGLKLNLRPQEQKIEVLKQLGDITISSPYSLASDTLQRVIFYLLAVLTNRDSVLVFEEPEAHAFPYYTKYLAETIALDSKNNQYFVSTHNPHFLLPVVEKAPQEEVAIFLTYYRNYQTRAKLLSAAEMAEVTEMDIFANLDWFLEAT